jgi:hypothetical protein
MVGIKDEKIQMVIVAFWLRMLMSYSNKIKKIWFAIKEILEVCIKIFALLLLVGIGVQAIFYRVNSDLNCASDGGVWDEENRICDKSDEARRKPYYLDRKKLNMLCLKAGVCADGVKYQNKKMSKGYCQKQNGNWHEQGWCDMRKND